MKLSKREIVMLTILAIIAIVFVEARLIVTPALNRLNELSTQLSSLQYEYQTINFNLTMAENSKKTVENNLKTINDLSQPFLDGVTPDSLLLFTHSMLAKHGFLPYSYSPSPISAELLQPDQVIVSELSYRLKELADQYRMLNNDGTNPDNTSNEGNAAGNSGDGSEIVEHYALQIQATGTYDQLKALLDDYRGLNKTIILSTVNIAPAQGGTGLLEIQFAVDYYGIEKLQSESDPINEWPRDQVNAGTQDPFSNLPVITETSEETTTPTETAPRRLLMWLLEVGCIHTRPSLHVM